MPALIPALIQLFMSRARGGRGGGYGGGGMPKPEKSAAEQDDAYWAKHGMSSDAAAGAFKAAVGAQPKLKTWSEALNEAKGN